MTDLTFKYWTKLFLLTCIDNDHYLFNKKDFKDDWSDVYDYWQDVIDNSLYSTDFMCPADFAYILSDNEIDVTYFKYKKINFVQICIQLDKGTLNFTVKLQRDKKDKSIVWTKLINAHIFYNDGNKVITLYDKNYLN